MSARHTPGPWILTTEATEVEGVNVRFSIDSHTHISICGGQSQEHMKDAIYEDECRANARLIAAAPELLEALKQAEAALARCFGAHKAEEGDRHRALATCRAARAKATGEQS